MGIDAADPGEQAASVVLFAPVGSAIGGTGQRKLAVDAVGSQNHGAADHVGGELFLGQSAGRDLGQTGSFHRDHERFVLTVFVPVTGELIHAVQ
ncbi:hypothetical protein SDC9_190499 [bioreactor metagenome]|uniref:Uncharacterized protein n=1 Tax=bioreactor metagenome TaxID=1076179 RepID=A0A645HV60_9ZZZZ